MHTALWCLCAVSIIGAIVSFARPSHEQAAEDVERFEAAERKAVLT
jgi:hypothetical protein